jgi:hypothetical protein
MAKKKTGVVSKNYDTCWETPKPNFTEEKAKMILDLAKDKGIEYYLGSTLKNQAEVFMQGVNAAKKTKGAK